MEEGKSSKPPIVITDEKILNFFEMHPELDPIMLFGMFIDSLEKMSKNMSLNLEKMITKDVLGKVSSEMESMKQMLQMYNTTLQSIQLTLVDRVVTLRENLTRDIREQIEMQSMKETSKLETCLKEKLQLSMQELSRLSLDALLPAMRHMMETELPKLVDVLQRDRLTKEELERQIQQFVSPMNLQIECLRSQQQAEMSSLTTVSSELIRSTAAESIFQKESREFYQKSLSVMERHKSNSSEKGAKSEFDLMQVLQRLFPQDVFYKPPVKSGDIIMERRDPKLPNILFETKKYKATVDKDEVKKFQEDIQRHKMHGIFLSQDTSIYHKNEFEIEIFGSNIAVYVPHANYEDYKLRIAIGMIDNMAPILKCMTASKEPKKSKKRRLQTTTQSSSGGEEEDMSVLTETNLSEEGGGGEVVLQNKEVVAYEDDAEEDEEDEDDDEDMLFENNVMIPKIDMQTFATEYANIANRKSKAISQLKAMTEQLEQEINKIDIPSLKMTLTEHKFLKTDEIQCKYCLLYSNSNQRSVVAHERKCEQNPKVIAAASLPKKEKKIKP